MATTERLWPAHRKWNLYQSDPASLVADFAHEKENLFTEDDELDVTIVKLENDVLGCRTRTSFRWADADQILEYILVYVDPRAHHLDTTEYHQQAARKGGTVTIIQIHQPFSWAELEISADAAQSLFTHLDISPGFWAVLKLFGSKENAEHESAGGFNEALRNDSDKSFEVSYTAKHAEEHGRPEVYDPWSIRQVGVHHKYDSVNDQTTFILLNPSKALSQRLEDIDLDIDALGIHRLILCAMTERWAGYLAYLESRVKDISKKAMLSSTRNIDTRGFTVRLSDSQSIQNLQDSIIRVSHMLELNLDVLENILVWSGISEGSGDNSDIMRASKTTLSSLSTLLAHTKKWRRHVESLLRRLDGSSVLIRSILDAKALETLQTSSRTTAELATLAREDGKKATEDARTLKTITILGFVYLPASFVATLLGTQYITIHDDVTGRISVIFAREMWIFVILTVILLLITIGTWLWWERRNQLADRAIFERSGKIA